MSGPGPGVPRLLRGDHAPSASGSDARGEASIRVDSDSQTVDVRLDVRGLGLEDLSTMLKAAQIGPIHLHLYGGRDHTDPNAPVKLVFAAPFGEACRASPNGFRMEQVGASYAQSAAALRSTLSFPDFVRAQPDGAVMVNVHANRWPEGEISDDVLRGRT